jgi:hypothetical protein
MELEKVPVAAPLVVFVLSSTVGDAEVDHTTPLAVTVAPPLSVIFPPLVAVVDAMELAAVVAAKVGVVNVVKLICAP